MKGISDLIYVLPGLIGLILVYVVVVIWALWKKTTSTVTGEPWSIDDFPILKLLDKLTSIIYAPYLVPVNLFSYCKRKKLG